MKKRPLKYNSDELECPIKLTTRQDKLGNVFHMVEFYHDDGTPDYVCFMHFSSALDFISTNFKNFNK